jgi:hypothetical protein
MGGELKGPFQIPQIMFCGKKQHPPGETGRVLTSCKRPHIAWRRYRRLCGARQKNLKGARIAACRSEAGTSLKLVTVA